MQSEVAIRDVGKYYGSYCALDHVDLDIRPGEFVTLLGPSGSGKTTLLNVLAGFVRPDHGSIKVDGKEFLTLPPHRRNLGMVFQNYALFPHMTVAGNVAYPLKLRGLSKDQITTKVARALETVQMGHLAERTIQALSGGQRQRVALARAIVFEPSILLMDEPLSALDKNLREHMQIEIKRLHDRLGTTTVYVTHDQREALTMSDRIAVLKDGRIVQCDTPSQLYDHPNDRFVAEFIGESSFLQVELKDRQPQLMGRKLDLRDGWSGKGAPLLLLRPEKLAWREPEQGGNRVDAVATEIIYQGDSYFLSLGLPDGREIGLRYNPHAAGGRVPERGQPVSFWLSRENTILIEDAA